jgi:hypothetical protein
LFVPKTTVTSASQVSAQLYLRREVSQPSSWLIELLELQLSRNPDSSLPLVETSIEPYRNYKKTSPQLKATE